MEIWGKMKKVELLATRDCEAGYVPGGGGGFNIWNQNWA